MRIKKLIWQDMSFNNWVNKSNINGAIYYHGSFTYPGNEIVSFLYEVSNYNVILDCIEEIFSVIILDRMGFSGFQPEGYFSTIKEAQDYCQGLFESFVLDNYFENDFEKSR